MYSSLAVLLAVAAAAFTSATPLKSRDNTLVKKHVLKEVPRDWEELTGVRVRDDHTLTLQIGLVQSKFDSLVKDLYEVSDPASPRYGQHLSKAEVENLVAPSPDTLSTVDDWLKSHSVDLTSVSRSPAKDWVTVTVPVSVAEALTGAEYKVFKHKRSGRHIVRTLEYSLPRELIGHIDVIQPTTFFGFRKFDKFSFVEGIIEDEDDDVAAAVEPLSTSAVPSSCNTTITPSCLRTLYNSVNYVPKSSSTNVVGVAGYLEQYANKADLQTFFKKYRTDAVGSSFTTVKVNGGQDDQSDPGVEANLDIQYTTGINYPTQHIYYTTGGSPPYTPDSNTPSNTNEPYLDWLNYVLNQTTIPQTFTTSYGDDEQTVPLDYAIRVCNTFVQLARGSSVLFSSGDGGVGDGDCKTNDGKNTVKFQPIFPSSCPYVTSVGGTYKVTPERAVSFSQGGFSNYFDQPSYQSSAVSAFLTAQGTTYSTYYNKTGRGFPDISAQGQSFAVVIGGYTESVGGTSASSPTAAAIISLLNDYRISQGKPTLGFLNPWLYGAGLSGLNDIVSGSNPGCGTNGFTARSGWDPVTGLGTPDFLKLQAALPA